MVSFKVGLWLVVATGPVVPVSGPDPGHVAVGGLGVGKKLGGTMLHSFISKASSFCLLNRFTLGDHIVVLDSINEVEWFSGVNGGDMGRVWVIRTVGCPMR